MAADNDRLRKETEKARKHQVRAGELKPVSTTNQKEYAAARGCRDLLSAEGGERRQNPLWPLLTLFYAMATTVGRFFHSQDDKFYYTDTLSMNESLSSFEGPIYETDGEP